MFQKGISGNPQGKPKGAANRTTIEMRDRLQLIVDNNLERLQADLDDLRSKDRVRAVTDLIGYILPKMTSSDTKLSIEKMSETELNALLDRLITNDEADQ